MGVFASRSPFRPNSLGLSSVKLEKLNFSEENGLSIVVSGADLVDGTPIYDIKPYLPSCDSHPDASPGYTKYTQGMTVEVEFPEELIRLIPVEKREALVAVLSEDPRPSYQDDGREYGMRFGDFNIKFKVENQTVIVMAVEPANGKLSAK